MFIYNVKLNSNILIKLLIIILAIIVISLACVTIYRVFSTSTSSINDESCMPNEDIQILNTR